MRRLLTGGMAMRAGLLLAGSGSAQDAGRTPPERVCPGLVTVHATAHHRPY